MSLRNILVALLVVISAASCYANDNPYHHRAVLDPNGRYELEWFADFSTSIIYFNVTVESRGGYVLFGLSRKGQTNGSDIVIGGVHPNGNVYFSDRHGLPGEQTEEDASQDWTLHWAWESATHTYLSFSRPFETCDRTNDLPINGDNLALLWGYGQTDNVNEIEYVNRGSFVTYLLDPDLTPKAVAEIGHHYNRNVSRPARIRQLGGLNIWTLPFNVRLQAQDTTNLCTFHKPPTVTKNHIVGFRTVLGATERRYIHHFLLFVCRAPEGVNADALFGRYVNQPGQECYALHNANNNLPTQYCQEAKHVWAVGGESVFFPDHVGLPMTERPDEYYMLQVHYDNPMEIPNIRLRFALEIFHTPRLRQNDGGMMYTGVAVPSPGSTSIVVPPNSPNHIIYGHCSSGCTRKMLPPSGIHLFAGILHTHLAGKGVRGLHIHNLTEDAPLADDNFNFNYQPVRIMAQETTVLPGDMIVVRCLYDTSNRTRATVGGYSSRNEMCNVFFWYYPLIRSDHYGTCAGELKSDAYRSTLGIFDTTWSDERREEIVSTPHVNAGLTVSEAASRINWDTNMRTQLQSHHRFLPQVSKCPSFGPEAVTQDILQQTMQRPNQIMERFYQESFERDPSLTTNINKEIQSPQNEFVSLWPKDLGFYRPPTICPA